MCKFISFVALVVVGISLPAITLAEFSSQSTGKPLRASPSSDWCMGMCPVFSVPP